ncbi:membrane protein [Betaproteobacteria bacterium]|nr:membrane protein [Betaproteobacteria bacterium]GHU15767.1 membrane protein [Betaproteobacteria bacterium]
MSWRRRSGAFLLWLALLGVLAAIAARTTFTTDMSVFLPDSPDVGHQLLVDQLKNGMASRLFLVGIEGGKSTESAAVSRQMAATLRADARFAEVNNGASVHFEADRKLLFEHRYALSPKVDAARFEVEGLRAALQETVDLLASSAGLFAKPLVTRDPSGEMMALLAGLNRAGPTLTEGVWMSQGGSTALLLALTRAGGDDLDAQEAALEAIRAAFSAALPADSASLLRLEVSGPGVFAVHSRETIKSEVSRIAAAGTVIIVVLLLLVFRSVSVLLLGLVPVITGALAGVASVSLGFGVVHGLTLGFGTTLIGEAVDYALYLLIQRGSASTVPSRFWSTIMLGLLTSGCGFVALFASDFPGLSQLGLYSLVGLITAVLITRYLLPALLPAGFRIRDLRPLGERLARLVAASARWRLLVPVLALASLAYLVTRTEPVWQHELLALSPVSKADVLLDQRLRHDLAAPDTRYLVLLQGTDIEHVLARAETLSPVLDRLEAEGKISGWDSPARYLPSVATQQRRLQSLPARDELARRLALAAHGLPLAADKLTPFLDEVEAARTQAPLTPAALAGTSLAMAVEAMLLTTDHGVFALLPLSTPATGEAEVDASAVNQALDAWKREHDRDDGGAAIFLDIKTASDSLYLGYLNEILKLTTISIAIIALLLSCLLRSPLKMLRIVAPLSASVLVVLAALILCGQHLILLHLVGLLLIVAVGSNYTLFFNRDDGPIAPHTYASLLFANLTTVAGYGMLAFSSVPVLQAIGMTVAPGTILALVFSAMLYRQTKTRP